MVLLHNLLNLTFFFLFGCIIEVNLGFMDNLNLYAVGLKKVI